ncbi:hypothetical protein SBA4_2650012 [Candidatus Sulfopaludibacter sp. SbA4]|nr:hypothetical protein SBA4_2650012 [Candidatus Sulfopaludibacter sp. SbA4]
MKETGTQLALSTVFELFTSAIPGPSWQVRLSECPAHGPKDLFKSWHMAHLVGQANPYFASWRLGSILFRAESRQAQKA